LTTVLELTEYESAEVELTVEQANALQQDFGDRVTVAPAGVDTWRIVAQQFVGTLRSGDLVVHIAPKVGLRNLLALMDVEVPSEIWRQEIVALQRDPDLLAVMARLFCVAMEDLSRRGIFRSYVAREERLVAPRGRIDLVAQMRRPGLVSPVACRFDEHTADTRVNRLLKAALNVARRVPGVAPIWQRRLLMQLGLLDEVQSGVRQVDWVERWEPSAMELHYTTAVRLAALLMRSSSLATQAGNVNSNSFLLNMNSLFERWVGRRMDEILSVEVREQFSTSLGGDGEIGMNPDLTFWRGSQVVAVADCKYKLTSVGLGRSSDYYQALAYATVLGLRECWLLYARLPGETPARDVAIRNSDIAVRTFALDLTGSIDAAVLQLHDFGRRLLADTAMAQRGLQEVANR